MLRKQIIILAAILFLSVSAGSSPTAQEQTQQYTQQAQVTLRAIAKQLGRFYAQHQYYPSATLFGSNFHALGMKEPPSKIWEYAFQCKAESCDAYAEHRRKYYSSAEDEGITPILRLTVRKSKPAALVYIEARSIWYIQKKNTTILMEQTYPVPKEICRYFGGKFTIHSECILD